MTQESREILQKALALPEEERTALIRCLIESLDGVSEQGVEQAWEDELKRRISDLDSGKTKTVPWEEIRQRISARFSHGK